MAFQTGGYAGGIYREAPDHRLQPQPTMMHQPVYGVPQLEPVRYAMDAPCAMPIQNEEYTSTGFWQPPHAPRLTAAAARASSAAGNYLYQGHDFQGQGYQQLHAPWHPSGYHYQGMPPQIRGHRQIEHQIMLHHQLSKLQAPPPPHHHQHHHLAHYDSCLPAQPSYQGYGQQGLVAHGHQASWGAQAPPDTSLQRLIPPIPPQQSQDAIASAIRRAEANRAAQEWQEASEQGAWSGSAHESTAFHGEEGFHSSVVAYDRDGSLNPPSGGAHGRLGGHMHQQQNSLLWADEQDFSRGQPGQWASGYGQWNREGGNERRGSLQPILRSAWGQAAHQAPPLNGHPMFPHASNHGHQQVERQRQEKDWNSRPAVQSGMMQQHSGPESWSAASHVDATSSRGDKVSNTLEKHEEYPEVSQAPPPSAEVAPSSDKGPAPPSPDTLDKSSVPIAAFGAQIIWNACAAFFEPELLRHAVSIDGSNCASSPSTSSSPLIGTPSGSPWSSMFVDKTAAPDWADLRSPVATERNVHQRNRSVDVSFGPVGLGNLPRLGARPSMVSRHRLTLSTHNISLGLGETGGNSSNGSITSTSEPGTPSSSRGVSPSAEGANAPRGRLSDRTGHDLVKGLGLNGADLHHLRSDENHPAPSRSSRSTSVNGSKASDKSRENILSVLRLVSPTWRWSNNEDKLESLDYFGTVFREEEKPRLWQTTAKPENTTRGTKSPREGGSVGVSTHASEPSPAFRRFAHQVLAQTLLSPTAYLLAVMYALRLPNLALLPDGSMDPEAIELFAQPPSAAPFKLFTLGMMIANKHLDDNTFLNKTWNEVTGIPLIELNQIESYFLRKCSYEVTVPNESWIAFLQRVKTREEEKLATLSAARRARSLAVTSPAFSKRDDSYRSLQNGAQLLASGIEDCTKRLLLILDEALTAVGVEARFDLNEPIISSPPASAGVIARRSVDNGVKKEVGRMGMQRPTDLLPAQHQQCGSAPALLSDYSTYDDLFDDEHSPFRPTPVTKPCVETCLSRSQSDYAGGPAKVSFGKESQGRLIGTTLSAPLVPSALLQGGRALVHGNTFAPLATSAWSYH
ncbi:hypothetical protein IE53DRAFT_168872 [Violaceomyces palustris]|uniref:Uncharacterized protein n=1 Tax=Violaceomyces palustris TaxID=1673888 RepID=A0ACD0NTB1_9BASI|nr:hypothetical protein IE53DRAFT_168872 [Violaceomyces palustris]